MSTRSEIAIERLDKSILSIYCHSDGYIEHNGVLLQNHYNSLRLARSIVERNDCSVLGETLEESRFYNDWRDEDTRAKKFDSVRSFMKEFDNNIFAEFIYLFKNNAWYVSELKFVDDEKYKDRWDNYIAYHTKFRLLRDVIQEVENNSEVA